MTALAPVSESLYQIEDDLNALLNSVDLCETDEQRAEVQAAIALTLERAVAKRDQVAAWMDRETSTLLAIDREIHRLKQLQDKRLRAVSKVEEYIASVILAQGPDAKGRFPKLKGLTSQFGVKKNPPAVEIVDEDQIPETFSSVMLQFSPEEWESFTGDLDMDIYAKLAEHIKSRTPNKTAIKKKLDQGTIVPGARLAPAKYRLERE